MGTYDAARSKTKSAIVQAFWKLYTQREISKITVRDITDMTGIHRATFYLYYDSVYAVLESIKQEQLNRLKDVCETYTSSANGYADFLAAMRTLYDQNEVFLEPLLCQHIGNTFATEYRTIMKEKLRRDIGWKQYPRESAEYILLDSILSGLIETFICCLRTRVIPLDAAYRIASQSVEHGIAQAVKQELGISVLPSG